MQSADYLGRLISAGIAITGNNRNNSSWMKNARLSLSMFFAGAFALGNATSLAGDWTLVRQNDRSYVTLANVARFYQLPEYTRVQGAVSVRSDCRVIVAQPGTCDLSINGLRFFANFPILTNGDEELVSVTDLDKIIEPVLRPSRILKSEPVETVVLDPGHGGVDSGASSEWGLEKDFTLEVALIAGQELIAAGYRVEMTRNSDVAVSLDDRVAFANGFPHAVFVSIHFNWSMGGAGLESYALAPEGVPSNASSEHHRVVIGTQRCEGNALDPQNIALTAAIHASALTRLSLFDRGVRHARFYVLRNIRIPAVLVEGGFISSPSDGGRIATGEYRQQLGAAIAQGIRNYDAAVNYRAQKKVALANSIPPPHAASSIQSNVTPEADGSDDPNE
jgi:N-acetylmuramoyl-L-alanine amidase